MRRRTPRSQGERSGSPARGRTRVVRARRGGGGGTFIAVLAVTIATTAFVAMQLSCTDGATRRDRDGPTRPEAVTATAAKEPIPGQTGVPAAPDAEVMPDGAVAVVRFSLEKPAQVSVAVYHEDGRRMIRTLATGVKLGAGGHALPWDGLDRYGRPAAPGAYAWKMLATPGFRARYLTTIGTNPGTVPYHDWVGNHCPPYAVAVAELPLDARGEPAEARTPWLYIGSMGENTPGAVLVSLDGSARKWSAGNRIRWGAVHAAQFVGDRLVELHTHKGSAVVFVIDALANRKLKSFDVAWKGDADNAGCRMAASERDVLVAYPGHDAVRWYAIDDGKTRATTKMAKPVALCAIPDAKDEFLAISDGAVVRFGENGVAKTVVPSSHLTNPRRLTIDRRANAVWVAEGKPSHRIKGFRLIGGRQFRALGREGGRAYGTYVPTDFREINDITSDGRGGLIVAEGGASLRRVVRIDSQGELVDEWIGSQSFFNFSSPDPDDPTEVWFVGGHQCKAVAKVDYATGTWRVKAEYLHRDTAGGLLPKPYHHSGPWHVKRRAGARYLFCEKGSENGLVRLDEDRNEIVPVAAVGMVRTWDKKSWPELWKETVSKMGLDPAKAPKTYAVSDRNGDGAFDASEMTISTLQVGGTKSFLDDDWNLWMGNTGSQLDGAAWFRIPATIEDVDGRPVPVWDFERVEAGMGKMPEPFAAIPRKKGRGLYVDAKRGVYVQIHANSYPRYDRPPRGWPTVYHGTSRLVKWSADGTLEWELARHAVRNPHNLFNPSDDDQFHDFTRIFGMFRECVIVGDRVVRPASAWTSDGLYAGEFFDRRADDGLPRKLYCWWRDRDTNHDGPVPYDCLTGGSIYPWKDDALLWFPMGEQNTPVYEVTGWTGWVRRKGTLALDQRPPHPAAEGTGLRAAYFTMPTGEPSEGDGALRLEEGAASGPAPEAVRAAKALAGRPAEERTDGRLWFKSERRQDVWFKKKNSSFAVRWRGVLEPPVSESYTFAAVNHAQPNPTTGEYFDASAGGVRVWLGGKLVLETWDPTYRNSRKKPTCHPESRPVALRAGERYVLRVEYAAWNDPARPEFSLLWESPSTERQRIPTRHLYPDAPPALPEAYISADRTEIAENADGGIQVRALLREPATREMRVRLQTGGSATPEDYAHVPEGLVVHTGETKSDPVTVRPVDDDVTAGPRDLVVSVAVDAAYLVDSDAQSVTIRLLDDELVVPDGLIAHYPMKRDVGRRIPDISGNGHHRYVNGVMEWSAPGNLIELKRGVEVKGRSTLRTTTGSWSIALRFKTSEPTTGFSWGGGGRGHALFLEDGDLKLKWEYQNPKTLFEGDLADDAWHAVALSVDRAAGVLHVYLDGARVHERKIKAKPDGVFSRFKTGGCYRGGPFLPYTGLLADFRVYERALGADEAAEIARSPVP